MILFIWNSRKPKLIYRDIGCLGIQRREGRMYTCSRTDGTVRFKYVRFIMRKTQWKCKNRRGEKGNSGWDDEEGAHWAPCALGPESDIGGRGRHSRRWERAVLLVGGKLSWCVECRWARGVGEKDLKQYYQPDPESWFMGVSTKWHFSQPGDEKSIVWGPRCLTFFILVRFHHAWQGPPVYFDIFWVPECVIPPLAYQTLIQAAIKMLNVCLKFPTRLT